MAYRFILILLIAFLTSFSCKKTYSSLKESGLKGKVKSVLMTQYQGVSKENGEWNLSDFELFNTTESFYNADGMITESIMKYLHEQDTDTFTTRTNFFIRDQILSGNVSYDSDGHKNSSAFYVWEDDYNYKMVQSSGSSTTVNISYSMNKKFKLTNITSEYLDSYNDEPMFHQSIDFSYTKNNEDHTMTITDLMTSVVEVKRFHILERDKTGNWTKSEVVDDLTNEVETFMTQTIEYY